MPHPAPADLRDRPRAAAEQTRAALEGSRRIQPTAPSDDRAFSDGLERSPLGRTGAVHRTALNQYGNFHALAGWLLVTLGVVGATLLVRRE